MTKHCSACISLIAASVSAGGPAKLAPVLQPFVDVHVLAGAVVLVADKDEILAIETVGWQDIAADKPMQPNSVFWIASQTKPVTGAALMILVDEGKVRVDDPVEKYLPEFRGQMVTAEKDDDHVLLKRPRHPILVREILTHTAGLPFSTPVERPTLDLYPLEVRVRSYAMTPLLFEPGTRSQYSNAGINTAGRIIEVVSGMSYEQFLDNRIFKPLGMKDTTFWPSSAQLARLARAYKPNADRTGLEECPIGQLKYPLDDPTRHPMPAGGLFSTAHDVSLFYRMLANDGAFGGMRILSESAVRQMTSDQSGEAHSNYGFGIGADGNVFTHGGAYNTNSAYDRKRGLLTVFLAQHAAWGGPEGEGDKILAAFRQAAHERFGHGARKDDAQLVVGIRQEGEGTGTQTGEAPPPENVIVYCEPGRYGGWPANHGLWQWGNELVVGFTAAWFKHATNDHAVDRTKPFLNYQARSLDGGRTWTTESNLSFADPGNESNRTALVEPVDFTAPGSALMFRHGSIHVGPSWFYVSGDRCRTWRGPFSFAVEGVDKICTRTDVVVLGKRDCLMLGSAAKSDDKEGRPFCARTTDGGLTWKLVGYIGPEPEGFAIMPSTIRLPGGALVTAIRNGKPTYDITIWRSDDLGQHWTCIGNATADIGGNPPSLLRLADGSLCLTYGCRRKPYGVRARLSRNDGRSWGTEIVLRDDGRTGDLGYARSVVRPDGTVLTAYYFNGPRDEDRTIQATLWRVPPSDAAE